MKTRLQRLAFAVMAMLTATFATAQVRTDGSVGSPAQSLAGPTYAITESLGRRAGNNLFHSFQSFNIGVGETALFSTTTPGIANVLGRVTGGEVSNIEGTIRLQAAAGAPSLFLINPAGVVFGAGAAIDVPRAFHVSTADSVRFPDGVFQADPARASTLSAAPPEAFGFLGQQRGAVKLQGAQLTNGDAPLTIVAGDVSLDGGGTVRNRGGDLTVVAVGQQAIEVPLAGEASSLRGTLHIGPDSTLRTESEGAAPGGAIRVAAGRIEVTGSPQALHSGIESSAVARGAGGAVSVRADEALILSEGAEIISVSSGEGAGGRLQVSAGSLLIESVDDYSTGIQSNAFGSGQGGGLRVAVAGEVRITGLGSIESYASEGTAGAVEVRADHLRLVGDLGVGSRGGWSGDVAPGPVTIAANQLTVAGGRIRSSGGRPAPINIAVEDTVRVSKGGKIGTDSGGPLHIKARQVSLDGGSVSAFSYGDGDSAGLTIDASERLEMRDGRVEVWNGGAGAGGPLVLNAGRLVMSDSRITSEATDAGRGGDIVVSVAGKAQLSESSAIYAVAEEGRGDRSGGNILMKAKELSLVDSRIVSLHGAGGGAAGDVRVEVQGRLALEGNQAVISTERSSTWNSRDGLRYSIGPVGQIVIRAGELRLEGTDIGVMPEMIATVATAGVAKEIDIEVQGAVHLRRAAVASRAPANADGSAIHLRAGKGVVLEDSALFTQTDGAGAAGNIVVEAAEIHVLASSEWRLGTTLHVPGISSLGVGTGDTANIRLRTPGALTMNGLTSISGDARGDEGRGGRIDIEAASLFMQGGSGLYKADITSRTESIDPGGDVALRISGAVVMRGGASINTDSIQTGQAGAVRIEAGSLLVQPEAAYQSATYVGSSARNTGDAGSVTIRLRGDLEVRDGGFITAQSQRGRPGNVDIQAANVTVAGQGVEAAGVRVSAIEAITFGITAGELGQMSVAATDRILVEDKGRISVSNFSGAGSPGQVTPGILHLRAGGIVLRDGQIDAASTGNTAASDLQLDAAKFILIQNGSVVTSATGTAGAGGNIRISGPVLALNTGFVQANAAAIGASGGDISLNNRALLSSHQSLRVGGDTVASFEAGRAGGNVVQAVAPTGVSGNIVIASPEIDVAGTLRLVTADTLPQGALGKSPCQRNGGSSLGISGRGGLAPSAVEPAGANLALALRAQASASLVQIAGRTGCGGV